MSGQEAYQSLYKRVRMAHIRHNIILLLAALLQSFFYAILAAGIAAGLLSLTPWAQLRIGTAAIIVALALPVALILFWYRRQGLEVTALLTDKHLRLKEKISSALEMGQIKPANEREEEWHHALLIDALREANRIDLKKAFPWQNPREARWLWMPVMILVLTVFILPQWDLLSGEGSAVAKAMDAKKVEKNLENLMQRQLILERRAEEEKNQQASELSKEIKELSQSLNKGKLEQREALAQLSSLEKKWEERKETLEKAMPKAGNLNNNPVDSKLTRELQQAMKEGNYKKAAEALQNLQKQMKMDGMSPQDQKRLSEELSKIAESMGMESALSKSMKNASMQLNEGQMGDAMQSLSLAEMDMLDLEDMLEQMKLLDEAMAEINASKAKMAGKCAKCGKKLGDKPGECDGNCPCPECGSGSCSGGSCNGNGMGMGNSNGVGVGARPWRAGDSTGRRGPGMGGPGQGRGGQAPFEQTDTQFNKEMLPGQMGQGPLQGMLPFNGPALPGESSIDFSNVVMQAEQQAEDALSKERIPAAVKNQVRSYFDSLHGEDAAAQE